MTRGLSLAGLGGGAALLAAVALPGIGATAIAIALGLVLALSGRLPDSFRPGLAVASRRVLRVGVALLGLQLALVDVLALGVPVLVVLLGVVTIGILGTLLVARWLRVDAESALLVAVGSSICGAAAIAAVDGVRRSRQAAVATAIALIVVFGSLAMVGLPLVARLLGLGPIAAGAWSGAAVHEVGQVVVAGGLVGGAALQIAVVVKLGRVLMLAPVLAVLSWRARRESTAARPPLVPAFVAAFVLLVVVRSVLPVPAAVLETVGWVQQAALCAAMFALGCGLDLGTLRRAGRRVVVLAGAATVLVAVVALPAAYVVA